jgi:hypothetical protein
VQSINLLGTKRREEMDARTRYHRGMDAAFQGALDLIVGSINVSTGIADEGDFEEVVELFAPLLDGGRSVKHPDEIQRYLIDHHKLGDDHARDIQLIYEALYRDRKPTQLAPRWRQETVDDLLRKP